MEVDIGHESVLDNGMENESKELGGRDDKLGDSTEEEGDTEVVVELVDSGAIGVGLGNAAGIGRRTRVTEGRGGRKAVHKYKI